MKTHLTMNDRVENPRTMNLMLRLFIYLFLIFSYIQLFVIYFFRCVLCLEFTSTYVLWCRCIVKNVHVMNKRYIYMREREH